MNIFNIKTKPNIGKLGETIAKKYLKKNGYSILEQNFTNNFGKRFGEIDLIAKKNNIIVFIEVKTRCFSASIPEENINAFKLRKLSKIINFYISKNNLWNSTYRLDALTIIIDKSTHKYKLKHLENIFL